MHRMHKPLEYLARCLLLVPFAVQAVIVTPEELNEARQWTAARFTGTVPDIPAAQPVPDWRQTRLFSTNPPFSFVYGGRPSAELLKEWPLKRTSRKFGPRQPGTHPRGQNVTEHTLIWTDSTTGLEVRCVAVEYHNFPTVEWTLYFRNGSSNPTPILEKIQALDLQLDRGSTGEFLLHHNVGSPADGNDYGPLVTTLASGKTKRIGATGGRPTNSGWSYFNLETGGDKGLIIVVGWPGQWAADFVRDDLRGLRVCAGQELTHFNLLAEEEVRSPLIVLQFWQGDWIRAQNIWRRWMMAHSMPKPGGHLPRPQFVASSSRQYDEMIKANETNQIMFIDRYRFEGLKLDYWWMDAGWYVHDGGGWPHVGTWLVDSNRFPHGLRAVSDHAHRHGIKTLVWFEPERVAADTWLTRNHPEWILGGVKGGLLNLGNDEARQWLTERVDQLLNEQGIDLYRQDFNMDPLEFWRKNDAEDRQGITEIRHVEGYFAYWDELRRRHPNMLIDSCASGGRRNDLETLRRAVPLLRSDYIMEPIGNQCHTYALSSWFPFYGTGTSKTDPYLIRSTLCPSFTACWDQRDGKIDFPNIKRIMDQWKRFAPNYFGDYYPITSYSLANDQWIGWQFDRPEAGEGMVQVFRREASPYESARFPLQAVDPDARYRVTNMDQPDSPLEISGKDLREKGLPVAIQERPASAFFVYTKL